VVVDVDPRHDGHRSLRRLVVQHGPLPDVPTVVTGGGGWHLYFAHPGGMIRNDAGRRLGAGVDVRGDGGYVIAPPSLHASGGRYELCTDGAAAPELPAWLSVRLEAPGPWEPHGRVEVRDVSAWAEAALTGELERLRGVGEGCRNDTLNLVAFRIGQIVGGGGLDEAMAVQVLVEAGSGLGLGERETFATVRSGLRAGGEHPRGPRVAADRPARPPPVEDPGPATQAVRDVTPPAAPPVVEIDW
jgi:hypothetical protein